MAETRIAQLDGLNNEFFNLVTKIMDALLRTQQKQDKW